MTLPLAVGACLKLAGDVPVPPVGKKTATLRSVWLAGAVAGSLAAFVVFGALRTDAAQQAQTPELYRLVAVHVFEHTLGYLLVAVGSVCSYLWWVQPHAPAVAVSSPRS